MFVCLRLVQCFIWGSQLVLACDSHVAKILTLQEHNQQSLSAILLHNTTALWYYFIFLLNFCSQSACFALGRSVSSLSSLANGKHGTMHSGSVVGCNSHLNTFTPKRNTYILLWRWLPSICTCQHKPDFFPQNPHNWPSKAQASYFAIQNHTDKLDNIYFKLPTTYNLLALQQAFPDAGPKTGLKQVFLEPHDCA